MALGVAMPALAAVRLPRPLSTTLTLAGRRSLPVKVWNADGRRRTTILFSHGAGSAPHRYLAFIHAWQRAGFRVLAPLHMDSTDHPAHKDLGLQKGWVGRLEDVAAISSQLIKDRSFVAAGHSWGALTALAQAGARVVAPATMKPSFEDPRISCVIALSPPAPSPQLVEAGGYRTLRRPMLVQTGTRDNVPDGDWRAHLAAHREAAPGDQYALILDGVDHCFGALLCRQAGALRPQPAALEQAAEVTVEFLLAYGAGNRRASRSLRRRVGRRGNMEILAR